MYVLGLLRDFEDRRGRYLLVGVFSDDSVLVSRDG